MIAVIYGTVGELIKLAPVLRLLEERGHRPLTLCTGQHVQQIPALLEHLDLAPPDAWLARGRHGRDVSVRADFPAWFAESSYRFVRGRSGLRRALGAAPLVLVHGDTFTTPLGALMGRLLPATVAHLEAGLRSGNWRHPFPEELDRRATTRLAHIHYAPGTVAVSNLHAARATGEIVDTGHNTVVDALELAPTASAPDLGLPDGRFGIVSIHRFELLSRPDELRALMDLLWAASRETPLLFVDYPVTAAVLRAEGLDDRFDDRLRRLPRQPYFDFVSLMKASAFVVTDSGGSQEECAQLGIPCLVHRATSERNDGLDGGSVTLSGMELEAVRAFIADPDAYARPPRRLAASPSRIVVEHLEQAGFL
ncbi:MAG: UDP-N-acetylglucosamine 2-epimerase [Solirubrobacterales bacterium]|nr:UDP-N-acetylglucosamine 2-epimerase [Solirubrobacterales bacterium]